MMRNPLLYHFHRYHVLDQLENLTPVKKCVEIELPSAACLNNLERLRVPSTSQIDL